MFSRGRIRLELGRLIIVAVQLVCSASVLLHGAQFSILRPDTNGWVRVQSPLGSLDQVSTILATTDLQSWIPIATLQNGPINFLDPATAQFRNRFYRLTQAPRTDADDWKNQVAFPDDPFLSNRQGASQNEIRWIKFAILLNEPYRVYYQNSNKYPFHYDFAVARLTPFQGMTRAAFDRVALHLTNQQVILGALLVPGQPGLAEYGIQFVGVDPYPPDLVARLFHVVRSTVRAPPGTQAFYLPAFEQSASADQARAFLQTRGIVLSSVERWASGDICYSSGWALARIQSVPADQIDAAYADGRLRPDDILLTDGVPAEIPFVAGILSTQPSTPNSHVAILARSHGLPFAYIANPAVREQIQPWVGKQVLLRTSNANGLSTVKVVAVDDDLDPVIRAEILALKNPGAISITPKAGFGSISAPVDGLVPSDIKYFGGKAANFGLLRRRVPDNSPLAVAFSFDLWDAFLNQMMPSGKTLSTEIAGRLSKYSYPADIALLRADLEAIRDLITSTAQFSPEQQQAILRAVADFPPNRKIRFRSSTNVEDTERFSGAGLYDSFSGCPADDQDSDTQGPSSCDPAEANERGVFRAIKKVYASFYNDNAFLERLRLGVDETKAGMAVLVHVSTPDEMELANGVATLRVDAATMQGELVTQAGALSVTNPDGEAQPEVVAASRFSFGTFVNIRQHSSLVPLGGYVLTWETEYRKLLDLLASVAEGYRQLFPAKTNFTLDFEYKKIAPGELSVKQVREVPAPPQDQAGPLFLINEPGSYCVYQGEFGDVFGNHRLKSRWTLATRNLRLSQTNLVNTFYTNANVELIAGGMPILLTNGTRTWPKATHTFDASTVQDSWTLDLATNQATFTLETSLNLEGAASGGPVLTQSDLPKFLSVRYAAPVAMLDFDGAPGTTTNETVRLGPGPAVTTKSQLQERTIKAGGVRIQTSFYWPEPPSGVTAGYTAPLLDWVQTRIEGLTAEPIVLHGYYSQTYRPQHHNFAEDFIFEPALEEGLSEGVLKELAVANVRLIHVRWGDDMSRVTILGFDGQFRSL